VTDGSDKADLKYQPILQTERGRVAINSGLTQNVIGGKLCFQQTIPSLEEIVNDVTPCRFDFTESARSAVRDTFFTAHEPQN